MTNRYNKPLILDLRRSENKISTLNTHLLEFLRMRLCKRKRTSSKPSQIPAWEQCSRVKYMFVSQKVRDEKGNITDARISAIDIGSPSYRFHCAVVWDKFMLVS